MTTTSSTNSRPNVGVSSCDSGTEPNAAEAPSATATAAAESVEPGAPDASVQQLTQKHKPDYSTFLANESACDGDPAFQMSVRRFAAHEVFAVAFTGDAASRPNEPGGFSTSPDATARVSAQVEVQAGDVAATSKSDPTHDVILHRTTQAEPSATLEQATADGTGHVQVESAAGNPALSSFGAPDIDTGLHFDYCATAEELALQGEMTGDDFPNAEVYVTDRVGNSVMLSTFQTEGGQHTGPGTLFGVDDKTLGEFNANIPLNPDGTFRMTCEQ